MGFTEKSLHNDIIELEFKLDSSISPPEWIEIKNVTH